MWDDFDILEGRGDYFGPVVNKCSRICGIAHGGQMLISEAIWTELQKEDAKDVMKNSSVVNVGRVSLRGFQVNRVNECQI